MFKCSNVPIFQHSYIPMFKCSNVHLFNNYCSNVQMLNVKCQWGWTFGGAYLWSSSGHFWSDSNQLYFHTCTLAINCARNHAMKKKTYLIDLIGISEIRKYVSHHYQENVYLNTTNIHCSLHWREGCIKYAHCTPQNARKYHRLHVT